MNNIEIVLNSNTSYLVGFIVGDGNISNYVKSKKNDRSPDYRIAIDIANKSLLQLISNKISIITNRNHSLKRVIQRGNRKARWRIDVRNKKFYMFLTDKLGLPKGKKSRIVRIPRQILRANDKIKLAFISGYFDADGGIRSNTIGFTTASEKLCIDVSNLMKSLNFYHSVEKWINRKYNRFYFGIKLHRNSTESFLNKINIQDFDKLERINKHLLCGGAGVAKRDR